MTWSPGIGGWLMIHRHTEDAGEIVVSLAPRSTWTSEPSPSLDPWGHLPPSDPPRTSRHRRASLWLIFLDRWRGATRHLSDVSRVDPRDILEKMK